MPNVPIASLTVLVSVFAVHSQHAHSQSTAPQIASESQAEVTLFDFSKLESMAGWIVVNDNVMGGRSIGGFELDSGLLVFSGSTNTDGGGFSSIRGRLPEGADWAEADGLLLRVRTSGKRSFKLDIRQTEGRSLAYRAPLQIAEGDGWQDVKVPFRAFSATWRGRAIRSSSFNPAAANQLGFFIYDGQDGPFHLEVARVTTYSETD
jgi:NADH dehydrogenase [ubiquinone] 1 alpha subcomplex assembly factor 1